MPVLWFRTLLQHAAVIAVGVLIGWQYDAALWGLLAAVSALAIWHIYHLYLLERWLRTEKPGP